ncbi:Uncharacterized protein PCOAH_00031830 [Plasmodium coatneyi]|uniref:Plasmodium RESA N-terminal domain-containing protein n=1 Tax=Plasmodium coatneyi TaxID=208452 RepID=A0A1B1E2R9_9APIC|nr:Uncharacterized protein PCOAH_00031830 [Plasmodium coatneyi]ANQ09265.1 Uncharacterized protein PCOAH_00031830 [Plasmodium coatneyi]
MLLPGAVFILLNYQEDFKRHDVNGQLQLHNSVGRNLASTESALPSQNKSELGRNKKCCVGKGVKKPTDEQVQEKKDHVGSVHMHDKTYLETFQELYDEMDNDDKEERKKKKEKEKNEKHEKLNKWDKKKFQPAGYDENEYLEEVPKSNTRSSRYDEEEYIDATGELDKLLFGELVLLEKYKTHRVSIFHYEMLDFDERLSDSEINNKLEEMEELPKKCELASLYWQSYINEIHKYADVIKRLFKKFLELKKKQTTETVKKYNKKWEKCGEIIGYNFKKQRDHVNDVFSTFTEKENFNREEFKEILNDIRDSWEKVTLKVTDECIALLEEPIFVEAECIPFSSWDRILCLRNYKLFLPSKLLRV